jgi:hypothetical protein
MQEIRVESEDLISVEEYFLDSVLSNLIDPLRTPRHVTLLTSRYGEMVSAPCLHSSIATLKRHDNSLTQPLEQRQLETIHVPQPVVKNSHTPIEMKHIVVASGAHEKLCQSIQP